MFSSLSPKLCEFIPATDTNVKGRRKHRCARCGYVTVPIPDMGQPIYRACSRSAGLGDAVAWCLSLVGITQPRMKALGIDCKCEERQDRLNQVGWEVADRWKGIAKWFT